MIELFKRLITKPTLFSVVGILMIILSIPIGIKSYLNSDPSIEGWVFTILLFLYLGIGFFYSIDRLLVKIISPIKLSIAEFSFTIICITLFNYSSRKLYVDISDSKENFVIIIQNNGQLKNSSIQSTSLFDNEIKTTDNLIIVNQILNTDLIKKPNFWGNSYYYNRYSFNNYEKIILFSNSKLNMNNQISETFIDSLIESKK